MIKLTINKEPLNFPTSWDEVTFGQYLSIMNAKSKAELICILLGKDFETFKKATITGLEDLFTAAAFTDKIPKFDAYYPQVGPYKLRKNNQLNDQFDIRFESLGQFEDTRQAMAGIKPDQPKELIKAYGKAVAIYLQKIRDKEYDPAKVPEVEEEIKSYRACEVIGLGQFFFLKLIALSNGTPKSSLSIPQNQKKSKPVSRSSKKRLGRTRR